MVDEKKTDSVDNKEAEKDETEPVSVLGPQLASWLADKLIHGTPLTNLMEGEQKVKPLVGVLQAIASGDLLVVKNPRKKGEGETPI